MNCTKKLPMFYLLAFVLYVSMEGTCCFGLGRQNSTTNAEMLLANATASTSQVPQNALKHTDISCPTGCMCSNVSPVNLHEVTEFYSVICNGGHEDLPEISPENTLSLVYANNRVPNDSLTNSSFINFPDVVSLNLMDSSIKYIEDDSFLAMRNLTTLYLDGNPIIRPQNDNCLKIVSSSLQLLSLRNVVPPKTSSKFLWELFLEKRLRLNTSNEHDVLPLSFTRLRTLRLDRNNLQGIDVKVLRESGMMTSLKNLGLSGNFLDGYDVFKLVQLIYKIGETFDATESEEFRDANMTLQYVYQQLMSSSAYQDYIHVNLTYNRITLLSIRTLQLLLNNSDATSEKSSTIHLTPETLKVKLSLRGNPINCTCALKPFLLFLFAGDETGKEIVDDWWSLECAFTLTGARLSTFFGLPRKICEDLFELSTTQVVFIVICSVVLSFVSVMVAYLNRRKINFYWNLMRNCGEEEENETSVRWRNTLDKYAIPRDHKGVGHKGYYNEEEANMFGKDSEDGDKK